MAINFTSDLDTIFDTDEYAQIATYTRQGSPGRMSTSFSHFSLSGPR